MSYELQILVIFPLPSHSLNLTPHEPLRGSRTACQRLPTETASKL